MLYFDAASSDWPSTHLPVEWRPQRKQVLFVDRCAVCASMSCRLKHVSGSQGLMLEGTSPSLKAPGGPHWDCPDKHPAARLDTLAAAGAARVPFTTGECLKDSKHLQASGCVQALLRSGLWAAARAARVPLTTGWSHRALLYDDFMMTVLDTLAGTRAAQSPSMLPSMTMWMPAGA